MRDIKEKIMPNIDSVIPCSHIIYKIGSTIKSKNGMTGNIDYSGSSASTVINSTINNSSPGDKTFIKNGTYIVDSTILYQKDNISIEGEGHGTVLRLADNANVDILSAKRRNNLGVILKNLKIDGNKANNKSGRGLVFTGYYSVIDNIYITNCKGNGFDTEVPATTSDAMTDNFVNNIRVSFCDSTGLVWGSNTGGFGSDNYLSNIVSFYNGGDGIDMKKSLYGNTLMSYNNAGHGVIIRGLYTRINILESDNNGKHGVYIYYTGCKRTIILGGKCQNNSKIGVGLYDGFMIDGGPILYPGKVQLIGCYAFDEQYIKTQNWGVNTINQSHEARNLIIGGDWSGNIQPKGINITNVLRAEVLNSQNFSNKGIFTASGTGSQNQFVIAHGLVSTPEYVDITAKTLDASRDKYWIADDTNIYVNFVEPPQVGIDNIILTWKADIQ